METTRRRFLRGAIATGVVAVGGRLVGGCPEETTGTPPAPPTPVPAPTPAPAPPAAPTLPDGLRARDFIVHGTTPLNLEMPPDAFGTGAITPAHRMFVRQNLPLPPADFVAERSRWRVEVAGVAQPRTVTLRELSALGVETVACVVQCSGNGRGFFAHHPSGSPWHTGAAANVLFTGVPVRAVVEAMGGLAAGARFLTATGGEPIPEGLEERASVVERSVPVEKAMRDGLLAWEMNGEPLPLVHGGPLRLVIPGYYGINQVKFVKRIAFAAGESDAELQRDDYRLRPIGADASPDQPSMWTMPVKSFVTVPVAGRGVPAGRLRIVGVAFSGDGPVRKVEVSTDGGTRWEDATFVGPDLGPFAWRRFTHAFDAAPGRVVLCTRATDAAGHVQPEQRIENHRGYGHNGWRDHAVTIEVRAPGEEDVVDPAAAGGFTPETFEELSEQGREGREVFLSRADPRCETCHTLGEAGAQATVGPNLDELRPTREQVVRAVSEGIGIMPAQAEGLTPAEIDRLADYVYEATRLRR